MGSILALGIAVYTVLMRRSIDYFAGDLLPVFGYGSWKLLCFGDGVVEQAQSQNKLAIA